MLNTSTPPDVGSVNLFGERAETNAARGKFADFFDQVAHRTA